MNIQEKLERSIFYFYQNPDSVIYEEKGETSEFISNKSGDYIHRLYLFDYEMITIYRYNYFTNWSLTGRPGIGFMNIITYK